MYDNPSTGPCGGCRALWYFTHLLTLALYSASVQDLDGSWCTPLSKCTGLERTVLHTWLQQVNRFLWGNHMANLCRHWCVVLLGCLPQVGYSLNALVDFPPSNPISIIKHLMVGSEGTLGFVSNVTYNNVPQAKHSVSKQGLETSWKLLSVHSHWVSGLSTGHGF